MAPPVHPARLRAIRRRLLGHYDRRRRELPWRGEKDPYRIWVSEVMLQQTRVETAILYYRLWMERFPTLESLAAADEEEILAAWSGLGYYRRARHLHAAARIVQDRLGGELPADAGALARLPGIGPYTAGAVASIAFDRQEPAVDGNARRVLARVFDLARPTAGELRRLAGALVPAERPGDFNQALMELGATVCRPRRPACGECPLAGLCMARRRGTVTTRPQPSFARVTPEHAVGTAVVLSAPGEVLVARRPAEGLLGGMWEFPGAVAAGGEPPLRAARRAARELLGGRAPRGPADLRPLAIVPHAFSHVRHVYHAFLLPVRGRHRPLPRKDSMPAPGPGLPAWTAAEWVAPSDLGRRALPAAQRTIAAALDQPPAAERSSLPGSSGSSGASRRR